MRLTPAYASLPGRMPNINTPPIVTAQDAHRQSDDSQATSTAASSRSSTSKAGEPLLTPPVGLQLDMSNLPSPSAQDQSGPQSTSDLPEVRTKSGRLIKPALRRDSMHSSYHNRERADSVPASVPSALRAKSTPNTPSVPKAVQFDPHLEHVKVFKFKQRPAAISRQGSPDQTETETEEERELFPFVNYGRKGPSPPGGATPTSHLSPAAPQQPEEQLVLRLPNFPSSARLSLDKDVWLERLYLADDLRSVRGTVRVRNIGFEKWVAIRFTLDKWVTVNEVSADHSESLGDGASDRFVFSIKLNELLNWPRGAGLHETKTMFLCIRYRTSGAEYWDNNDGQNYQLDFKKRQIPPTPLPTPVLNRPGRSQSLMGNSASSQQGRIIDMVKRHGVSASKTSSNGFVEDLRRELDKLKSDEEDGDRPPILTKKLAGQVAQVLAAAKGGRNSPPVSPNARSESPMWTARYDWNESLRNPNASRARGGVYDYFSSKPIPAQAAAAASTTSTAAGSGPHFTVSAASPPSRDSSGSSATTPLVSAFGQTRAGMLSPAVGDVFAHHRPVIPSDLNSPSNGNSVDSSVQNSACNSPNKFNDALDVPSPTTATPPDARRFLVPSSAQSSPTQHRSSAPRFPNFAMGHRSRGGQTSPFASVDHSLEGSDEEEDQADNIRLTSRSQNPRVVTVPKTSIRRGLDKKDDGLVLENYDREDGPALRRQHSHQSTTHQETGSVMMDRDLFSPATSISSVESETNGMNGLVTPEDGAPARSMVGMDSLYEEDSTEARSSSSTAGSTPRLATGRRWSPVTFANGGDLPSSNDATVNAGGPRTAAELNELISKYCWSSDAGPSVGGVVTGGNNSTGNGAMSNGYPEAMGLYDLSQRRDYHTPPRLASGAATPTADF